MSHKEVVSTHTFQELERTLTSLSFLLFWGIIIVSESQLESKNTKPPRLQRLLGITLTRAKKKFRNSPISRITRITNFIWRMNKEVCEGFKSAKGHCTSIGKDIFILFLFTASEVLFFNFYFIIGTKKKIFFHYTYQSQFSPLPISSNFPLLFPLPLPRESKANCSKEEPRPSPPYSNWARYPSRENRFQKASKSRNNESWYHCQWSCNQPQAYSCYPH